MNQTLQFLGKFKEVIVCTRNEFHHDIDITVRAMVIPRHGPEDGHAPQSMLGEQPCAFGSEDLQYFLQGSHTTNIVNGGPFSPHFTAIPLISTFTPRGRPFTA